MAATKQQSEQPLATAITVAVVVSFVAVVLAVIVGRILINQISLNNRIISRKQQAQMQLDKNLKALNQLAVEYDQLGASKAIIADALPETRDFPSLSGLMENLTKVSGVTLRSVSADSLNTSAAPSTNVAPITTGTAGAQEFHFTIAVNGSYSGLLNLIRNLELSARPMRVTVVSVGGSTDGLDVKLSITTYYQGKSTVLTTSEAIN